MNAGFLIPELCCFGKVSGEKKSKNLKQSKSYETLCLGVAFDAEFNNEGSFAKKLNFDPD